MSRRAGGSSRPPRAKRSRNLPSRRTYWGGGVVATATVVGTIAGVLQLFGAGEAGDPSTPPVSAEVEAFQRSVGEVCDEANDAARRTARRHPRVARALFRARSVSTIRTELLNEVQRRLSDLDDLTARLTALDVPGRLADTHRTAVRSWTRTTDRLRTYRDALSRASERRKLRLAVGSLNRAAHEREARAVNGQLRRLGGDHCDLRRRPPLPVIPKESIGVGDLSLPAPSRMPGPGTRPRPVPPPVPREG